MTALEQLLERLSALKPGHSARVTNSELMKIEVLGCPITSTEPALNGLGSNCRFYARS